jgi:hypothetical protein
MPLSFYQRLREENRALRCDFFEGVMVKWAGFDLFGGSIRYWQRLNQRRLE